MTGNAEQLPDGWTRRRVGDVLKLLNGHAFKASEWTESGKPIIRIQNLKSISSPHNYYDGTLPDRFSAKPGDLLFAWSGTPGTSFGAHVWTGPEAWINQHIFRVDFSSDDFDRDFLKLALTFNLNDYISEAQGGVGLAHITKAKLNESRLITPPLPVQRQIATRFTEYDQRRASALGHLARSRRAVERFRGGVLSAACSGRLTADWREERKLGAWEYLRAGDACAKVQSGTTPKVWHAGDDGIPFLKVYNLVNQRLDFDHRPQFISEDLHHGPMSRAAALPGDVLMNIVGPPLGKVAIVTDQYAKWSINQALTLFRPSEIVTTNWLYVFLCSGISVGQVLKETRGTVGQVNISLSQCRDFQLPVPTVEEQDEISIRVERLLCVADRFRERIERAAERVERTYHGVLAKAFNGEFVRGDEVQVK